MAIPKRGIGTYGDRNFVADIDHLAKRGQNLKKTKIGSKSVHLTIALRPRFGQDALRAVSIGGHLCEVERSGRS